MDAAQARVSPEDTFGQLDAALAKGESPVASFRSALESTAAELNRRFDAEEPVEHLVRDRARMVDGILLRAWRQHLDNTSESLALVAVGGYGRGELHPCSDIDVMVLFPGDEPSRWRESLEAFVTFLWDIGLEAGHSVRSLADCVTEAEADITVATTLMEARLLTGNEALFEAMAEATGPQSIWDSRSFFEAKLAEQEGRHHRYHDTAYNLEPNIKGSPGGLRDIQVVGWVAKRHFGARTLHQLHQQGFLTGYEYRRLLAGQTFLWRIRWALHTITGRREDRLLFDHQVSLATLFGYEDATFTLAVEQFMQKYYRTVMELSRLNEMLLQLFQEAILMEPEAEPRPINARFQVHNGFLEVTSDDVFELSPSALLEIFHLLQEQTGLKGVSAETIRLIRKNLPLIDEEFRQNPRHHRLFMEILRAPKGVTHELRRMNLYGVLGRCIPAFGRVVGRMQFDLFHAYTVDAHTLFVVSNLRRFALTRFDHEMPRCSRIMQELPKPELAYLAGLFHDIAKGRGGDHSELGAVDAESFCLEQGLSPYDARLVAWLVRNHLVFSITAQKKDIRDPEVINAFARQVGDQNHLNYLFVLTVADVTGTNPKLWNSWKETLFEEFYDSVRRALMRGLEQPVDEEQLISETQTSARDRLRSMGVRRGRVRKAWQAFTNDYFLRYSPEEIAWHTRTLVRLGKEKATEGIAVERLPDQGVTGVLVVIREDRHGFARATAVLDELGVNVQDARVVPIADGRTIQTYHVLEGDGSQITETSRLKQIDSAIRRAVQDSDGIPPMVTRQAPRQVRMFSTPTRIAFSDDEAGQRTLLEIVAADRPGLLSEVGKAFVEAGIVLRAAKVMTIGERAEDVFFVTDRGGHVLDERAQADLAERLAGRLDDPPDAKRKSA